MGIEITCIPVTPVCEWSNNKSASVSQVLVCISDSGGDHPHKDTVILEVVTQLTDPLEVVWTLGLCLRQFCNCVSSWKVLFCQYDSV